MIVNTNELFGRNVELRSLFKGKRIIVEAGFGNGEFTIFLAKKYPDSTVVGVEVSGKSIEKLKRKMERDGISNIKIIKGDIRSVLSFFPDSSIDSFYCNFPDPWWKNRHKKRRIFSEEFIKILFNKMKPGGMVEICTDHTEYSGFIMRNFERFGRFLPGFGKYPIVNFLFREFRTKYEEKFIKMCKTIYYFRFLKP